MRSALVCAALIAGCATHDTSINKSLSKQPTGPSRAASFWRNRTFAFTKSLPEA